MNAPQPTTAVLEASAVEPVTLAVLKKHCRVVADDEDAELAVYLAAAREQVERDTQLSLLRRTIRQRQQCWPDRMLELSVTPLISVTSIEYLDVDEATQTLAAESYYLDADRRPGAVWRKPSYDWPELAVDRADAITITYVAGHAADKPAPVRAVQAILLIAGHAYRNREAVVVGTISSAIELGYQNLIRSLSKERHV